jgi:hypothetical protein
MIDHLCFAHMSHFFTNLHFFIFTENVPPVALNDDRVVEIQGEPLAAHKAVELIASHLRKFLVDRSVLPLFEMQASSFMQCSLLLPRIQNSINIKLISSLDR